jgi:L-lactate dehydrogenase (cytochrome)
MMRSREFHNVADVRRRAGRVLPRVVFDYVEGGADDEVTLARNEQAFRDLVLRPHMAVDVDPDLATSVLGTKVTMPILLAPCGLVRLMHPDGAAGALRAARSQGTVSVMSSVAGVELESLTNEPGHKWFQLYSSGGRDEAEGTIARAQAAGFEALVVTVDTPALGNRERDLRNGVKPPLRLDARTAMLLGPQVLLRPRWGFRMLRDGISMMSGGGSASAVPATASTDQRFATAGAIAMLASPFTWADIAWMRKQWSGPLVVKGILSGDDALRSVDAGADAVVVSNHGGRQLDGAPATAQVLPEVADAVGGQAEVLIDGGVRRGGDVVKALALGAKAVLIGRPYLYGLIVNGQQGVEQVLQMLRAEMARSMRLLGCPSVEQLDRSWLQQ